MIALHMSFYLKDNLTFWMVALVQKVRNRVSFGSFGRIFSNTAGRRAHAGAVGGGNYLKRSLTKMRK